MAPQHANASARQPVSLARPSTLPYSDAPVFAALSTGEAAATPPLQACAALFSWVVLLALASAPNTRRGRLLWQVDTERILWRANYEARQAHAVRTYLHHGADGSPV